MCAANDRPAKFGIFPVLWPLGLIGLRLALGPAMVLVAWGFGDAGGWILVMLLWLGVLSDIFDGIIARRLGVATAWLRRLDSQTDLVFFACASACCAMLHGSLLRAWAWPVGVLAAMEASGYIVSYARFGREPCTHAYSAKLFGIALLAAMTSVLGFGYAGWVLGAALAIALVSEIDTNAIQWVLPKWTSDVPSVWHAWRIRRGLPIRRHALFHSA
jgi:phosphatidylglycerophosphate synthase